MKLKLIAAGALVLSAFYSGHADDWSRWRGPYVDGISREKSFDVSKISSPSIMWSKELGDGFTSVSIKDDKLYTMGHRDGKDTIYCLNPKSGAVIWTYSYEEENGGNFKGPRATPVFDDSKIYTQSCTGKLFCLDASTGKVIWKSNFSSFGGKDIRWHYAGSAVIYKDLVLYNSNQHGIALNKKTGELVWKSPSDECGYATPVLYKNGKKNAVALFGSKGIYGVDVENGTKLWSLDWETKYNINGSDPIVRGREMFISSAYKTGSGMLQFSEDSAKVLWKSDKMQNQFDTSVVIKGHLYGVSGQTGRNNSTLTCMEWKTGNVKWSQRIGGYGTLSAVGKKLIVLTEKGNLIIAKATSEKYIEITRKDKLFTKEKCWIAPVLSNGILYCKSNKGKLLALDVR